MRAHILGEISLISKAVTVRQFLLIKIEESFAVWAFSPMFFILCGKRILY
jgi:hypothetical protein